MEQSFVAYTPSMMPALLDIWNAATGGDLPLGEALWRQNIENHPLFQPKDCLVAIADDGGLAGFTITRIVPEAELRANPDMAQYREWGHVMALAVQRY